MTTWMKFVLAILCIALSVLVVKMAEAANGYEPDENRLDQKAKRSTELYVDPYFNFTTHKTLTLDVMVADAQGEAIANAMIFVYSVPQDVEDLADERLVSKSLLGIVKTDDTGGLYQTLEVSPKVSNLLLEVRVVGMQNQALFNLAYTDTVQFIFGG